MMLAALLLAAAAPPIQADDPVAFDIRCMVVMGQLRESQDATVRAHAESAAMFFFGRIDTEIPQAQLEARMWQEVQMTHPEDTAATARACGIFMQGRGRLLEDIGHRLEAREQAQQTH